MSPLDPSDDQLVVTAEPALRKYWYPVARADAVTSKPVARRLLGTDLVLWRPVPSAVASAAADRCLHRDARLSRGWLAGSKLVCPYHGWEYGGDGSCLSIPVLGPAVVPPARARLATFAAREQWGWVWVRLEDSAAELPVSELVPDGSQGWREIHEPESEWDCHPFQLVDNNLDTSHIPFVHQGSFGGKPEPDGPVAEVSARPFGLRTRLSVAVSARPGEQGDTVRTVEQDVILPLLLVSRISYPDGTVQVMIKMATPVDDTHTRQLQLVLRNDSEQARPADDIIAFDAVAWKEDHLLLANTWPEFHLDLRSNVHLKADRASVEYRRALAAMLGRGVTAAPAGNPDPRTSGAGRDVRPVRVVSVAAVATDTLAFTLVDPGGEALPPWQPGAHVDLVLPSGLERQYSLCGDPGDLSSYRITVLREPAGRGGSAELHDQQVCGGS